MRTEDNTLCINCNHEHGWDVVEGEDQSYWFIPQLCEYCECKEFEKDEQY